MNAVEEVGAHVRNRHGATGVVVGRTPVGLVVMAHDEDPSSLHVSPPADLTFLSSGGES